MRISLLALEGLFDTGLSVTLDAFTIANRISARQMGGTPFFEVSVVGVRKRVRSGQGFAIPVRAVTPDLRPDWVIVPALSTGMPEQLIRALGRREMSQAKAQLRKWYEEGANIAASCIGTFILAEAGLLDSAEATTTWWLAPLFRQRYPKTRLDESRSSQAPHIIPNHLAQGDPLILRFEHWARDHLKTGFSLQESARALSTARALCSAVAMRCSVNRRLPTFRICVSNARNLSFTGPVWMSRL